MSTEDFDPNMFEEVEFDSESVTSGSEYVPSSNGKSDTDSELSDVSLSTVSIPKKKKFNESSQMSSNSDSQSITCASQPYTIKSKKAGTKDLKRSTEKEDLAKEFDSDDSGVSALLNLSISSFSDDSENNEKKSKEVRVDLSSASESEPDVDIDLDWKPAKGVKRCDKNKNTLKKPAPKEKLNITNGSASDQSSFNLSLDINLESVGPVMRNKFSEVVLHSQQGSKKNCCFYCLRKKLRTKNKNIKVLYTKLVEHYEKAHKNEELIQKLNRIPKEKRKPGEPITVKAAKRLKILDALRLKANHINNLQAEKVEDYVLARRPNPKRKHTVAEYDTCYNCHKRLSVTSSRKHVVKCSKIKSFKKHRVMKSLSRATNGDYHEIASENAIKIISVMQEKNAVNEIRYDTCVFVWLNAEATMYEVENQKHNLKKVRANIGRLGTLLYEIKKINPNIFEFSDILHENNYEDFIKAVKIMGKPHPVTGYMQSPSTAGAMYHLIKEVAAVYDVYVGSKDEEKRLAIQGFDKALNTMWHKSIGNTIAQTHARSQKNTVKVLPNQPDMILLRQHLEKEITENFEALQNKYSDSVYEKLSNVLQSYLQFTNCRRPGEVERMELVDFQNRHSEGDECRIQVRGKRTRPVPIVFPKTITPCLEWLVMCRPQAKIHINNPFIFANIHDVSQDHFSCASGCKLLEEFANNCGAQNPRSLKATLLRMQLATDQMEKGIDDNGLEKLSGFMGHTPKVHCQNYRQSVVKRDIQIARKVRESQGVGASSQLLNNNEKYSTLAQGEDNFEKVSNLEDHDASHNNGILLDQPSTSQELQSRTVTKSLFNPNSTINTRIDSHEEENAHVVHNSTRAKFRAQSSSEKSVLKSDPETTAKRKPWLSPAKKELLSQFPNALNLEYKLPSADKITGFLLKAKDPILRERTEPQVRVWLHSQRNLKKNKDFVPERHHIPTWIYSSFDKYIAAKKLPSHKTCAQFLAKSPSKNKVSIEDIQTWVKKAIQKTSNS